MCGIYGVFGSTLDKEDNFNAFKALEHRGPDDFYTVSDNENNSFTSSAVRLAFQDLEHGRQPFVHEYEGNKLVVSLNGEIYNHMDLRKNFISKEFQYFSNSDTESILFLYKKYGIDFVNFLRGMYAISIWDSKNNKGYLITDYFAQKPIFYTFIEDKLFFSSELESLIILVKSEKKINEDINNNSLIEILNLTCVVNGKTIYKDIKRLKPFQILEFDALTKSYKLSYLKRFLPSHNKSNKSEEDVVRDIRNLLLKAIEKRVDSSIPQSLYLSGGVDSSLIACMLRELYPKIEINTFTLSYCGKYVDQGKKNDSQMAEEVSIKIDSSHHNILVNPGDLSKYLKKIIKCYGEPFTSAPSIWFISKEIAKISKYSLSGDGADELFGSYYTHRISEFKKPKNSYECIQIFLEYYQTFLKGLISEKAKLNIKNIEDKSLDFEDQKFLAKNPILNQLLVESKIIFPYKFLTYIDRLSMAHSVEPRSPFLDKDLWDYVICLPDKYRIKNGQTKLILKKLAELYLPKEIVHRKKEGLVFPLYPYLIKDEEIIKNRIIDFLNSNITILSHFISDKWIKESFSIIKNHKYKAYKRSQVIHTMNIISLWFEEYF